MPPSSLRAGRPAVLVTGASSGIGRECAMQLDARGFHVYAGVRDAADAERLRSERPTVDAIELDVTRAHAIDTAVARLRRDAAPLVGLVNNAGITTSGALEFLTRDDLVRQFEVNVFGAHAVTRAMLPLLRAQRGRVVNMGSIAGRLPLPFTGPYGASKAAFAQLTGALRQELRPWGMRVVLVEPGPVATPIFEKGIASADAAATAMPPAGRELYARVLDRGEELATLMARGAVAPARVARVVAHALTAPRPRARYLVGRVAWMQAIAAGVLPVAALDWVIARQSGWRDP